MFSHAKYILIFYLDFVFLNSIFFNFIKLIKTVNFKPIILKKSNRHRDELFS